MAYFSKFLLSLLLLATISVTPAHAGYVANDPLNNTDPTGKQAACAAGPGPAAVCAGGTGVVVIGGTILAAGVVIGSRYRSWGVPPQLSTTLPSSSSYYNK